MGALKDRAGVGLPGGLWGGFRGMPYITYYTCVLYIYIYMYILFLPARRNETPPHKVSARGRCFRSLSFHISPALEEFGRGVIRLETLIELKCLNSFFRVYPLVEIRQTVPYRAMRADSISVNSTLPPLRSVFSQTPVLMDHAYMYLFSLI